MVKAAKESEVFAAGKSGVEADVAARVIAELAANGARIENGIVAGDLGAAGGGQQQRGENAEERGFTGAIRAKQGQGFAGTQFERNPCQSDDARFFERLEKSSPAAAGGRKKLLESGNAYRGFRHEETYSVSAARRQSARARRQPAANHGLHSLHSEGRDSPVECRRSNSSRTKEAEE
jgi:hypothetical protein